MICNEKNFIKRLKNGKEDSLEYIIDTYLPLVKGVTYKILSPLNNNGIIEECINDVFLSVWKNAIKFDGEKDDFRKWICAISKFKAIDYYRREIKSTVVSIEEDTSNGQNLVEEELLAIERRDELIEIINSLGDSDKEIFIMKYFLDMKSDNIAQKLGVTKASVDNKISRCKKKLKTKLNNRRLEAF